MLKRQGLPDAQINMFVSMMEKNPKLFETIAKEIEQEVKAGKDQTVAGLQVMKKYEVELKKLV